MEYTAFRARERSVKISPLSAWKTLREQQAEGEQASSQKLDMKTETRSNEHPNVVGKRIEHTGSICIMFTSQAQSATDHIEVGSADELLSQLLLKDAYFLRQQWIGRRRSRASRTKVEEILMKGCISTESNSPPGSIFILP